MWSISRLPSSEPSFNIYELLSMKANLLIKRSLKRKMAHKQQDVRLVKTCPQRHENQATWHFQASSPQHTQMLRAIHGLFSQQKRVHSLSTKGTKSFLRYKLQTIYILEVQIIFFHSKIQNIHPNIIYVRFVYKCKLCQLTMIEQTQSGTYTTK